MTPRERAEAVFAKLVTDGVQPLDDVSWMNPEDKEAIIRPIEEAIELAIEDALDAEWQKYDPAE